MKYKFLFIKGFGIINKNLYFVACVLCFEGLAYRTGARGAWVFACAGE